MLYHSSAIEDMEQKSGQSRAFLNFLANSVPDNDPYGLLLKKQSQASAHHSDAYFVHEWLEADNDPVYFHEFVSAANSEGLQYLGDVDISKMFAMGLPKEVVQTLRELGSDQVRFEQYLDFVCNRQFRRTLLCHRDVSVYRDLKSAKLDLIHLRSTVTKNDDQESNTFRSINGHQIEPQNDTARLLLQALANKYPDSLPFLELREELSQSLASLADEEPGDSSADDRSLNLLLDAIIRGLIKVTGRRFQAGCVSDEFMQSPAYARYQAKNSFDVTNRFHERKTLDPIAVLLIRCLDGKTTRESLIEILSDAIKSGDIELKENEQKIKENKTTHTMLTELVAESP